MKDIHNIKEKGLQQPEFKNYNGFFKAIFYGAEKDVEEISGWEVETEIREVEREAETGEREVEKLTDKQKMMLYRH
jgi:predicted HTH transcriptional regulator